MTLAIIGCFTGAVVITLAILNRAGTLGGIIGNFLTTMLGVGAFMLPLAFLVVGFILINMQKDENIEADFSNRLFWGMVLMLWPFIGFINMVKGVNDLNDAAEAGGVIGYLLYPALLGTGFGSVAGFILFAVFLFGFFLVTKMTFADFVNKVQAISKDPGRIMDIVPDASDLWKKKGSSMPDSANINRSEDESVTELERDSERLIEKLTDLQKESAIAAISPAETEKKIVSEDDKPASTSIARKRLINWTLPSFKILNSTKKEADPGDIETNKQIIQDTLSHFNIEVEMKDVVVGPRVSQYQLKPANGVRLSAIDKLQKDLSLALAGSMIRIQAPIPGKSLVGIEIPNRDPSSVSLRDLLQTKGFIHSKDLTVAIGKDVAGDNVLYPIAKMPHLLVAGATGSGKSVWINGMLLSLLYKYSPDEVQIILVDMKRVELKLYEGIPHLLTNVITESDKAINALKWTVLEMDKRYQILEDNSKRNIEDYNSYAKRSSKSEPLPYIVFVIDELADLMMLAKSEVEPIVARLTQMSRAVGIHLVLGTQRPDTTVITGLIKANVPTRISFAVASGIDSRVILDNSGADKLLGKGDGLMISPTNMYPVRFQGAFVSDTEVKETVNFLKSNIDEEEVMGNYQEEVINPPTKTISIPGLSTESSNSGNGDEAYEKAKLIVIEHQKGSASFLQQMMGIGYPKASKIIMQLEQEGIVGPQNGSKPREVYVPHL